MYGLKDFEKALDKMKMPKVYRNRILDLERLMSNDITIWVSIRKDSGKTTSSLLIGLVWFFLSGERITTEYMRCDKTQITRSNIETLYDVILKNHYVEKLFSNKYNTIIYKSQLKKFYLAFETVSENGEPVIEYTSENPLCHVSCLEEWQRYKSSYNNVFADFLVLDEMFDSQRSTLNQMVELQNNISTFGRGRAGTDYNPFGVRLLCLGNNVSKYSFWWSEFCIEDEIQNLQFGNYIERETELGTRFCVEMLSVSDEQKKIIKDRKIRFSGFNTPKMGAFNGIESWQGSSHPHIPLIEMVSDTEPIYNLLWLRFRNRYVRFNIYYTKEYGFYIFVHNSLEPKFEDGVILTDEPQHFNEFYGLAESSMNEKVIKLMKLVKLIINDKRIYYESNSIGDMVQAYLKEVKLNR